MNVRGLFVFSILIVLVCNPAFADPAAGPSSNPIPQDYRKAMAQVYSPTGVQDFIAQADQLGDADDSPSGRAGLAEAETKLGLHMTFTIQRSDEAVLYYYSLSRNGAEFHYSEAVKLIALFADRFGLTHPVEVTSGERDIYYAQWLFKPSDFKKLRKLMVQARARNRAEKDPIRAFSIAIQRELDARGAVHSDVNRDPRR